MSKIRRVTKAMKLFPVTGRHEDVALEILCELIATRTGFKNLLVITCRCTKTVKVVPQKRIMA